VRAAVRSAFVMVPAKRAAPVAAAWRMIWSWVAVDVCSVTALETLTVPANVALSCTSKMPVPLAFKVMLPLDVVDTVNAPFDVIAVELSVRPLMVDVHAKAPVLLVRVQPVEPDPPPRKMSPVDVPPMSI